MIGEKKCSKCKKLKPDNDFSEGRALCNKCIEYKRQYREQHREEINIKAKEYYERNKEKVLENKKEYREQNRDAILEKKKQYRENHKEEIQMKKKEYYENNKEQIQEKQKENNDVKIECAVCKCKVGKPFVNVRWENTELKYTSNQ